MRSGDTGCSIEACRVGWVVRDGAQAGTGDPTAINSSIMISLKNVQTWSWTKLGVGVTKKTKK